MSTAPYTHSFPQATSPPEGGSSPLFAVASVLLGLLVVVLAFVAVFMWFDAHEARDAANRVAAQVTSTSGGHAMPGHTMPMPATGLGDLTSYAGAAPANAMDLAARHKAYPAEMPAIPAGPVAH